MWCKVSIASKRKGQCERELLKCVYWWNKLLLTNTLSLLTQWGLWIYKNHAKLVCEYFLWLRVTELWFVCLWILYPVTYYFLYSFIYLLIDDLCWSLFRITIISQHHLQLIYLFIYPLYIHLYFIYIYIYICENWIGIVLYIKSLIVILLLDFMNKTCRNVNIVCVSFWLINRFKFIKK